jgi:hypothetical protein
MFVCLMEAAPSSSTRSDVIPYWSNSPSYPKLPYPTLLGLPGLSSLPERNDLSGFINILEYRVCTYTLKSNPT